VRPTKTKYLFTSTSIKRTDEFEKIYLTFRSAILMQWVAFELLGTFTMAVISYPSSPHSNPCLPACLLFKFPTLRRAFFAIVQTSLSQGQHLCSKSPPRPVVPPFSGITLIIKRLSKQPER